jgi:hypothetical protein
MIELLSNKYFQFFVIPLLTTLLTVFVKIVSRNDRFSSVKKEDFAIGMEIAITAILLLTSDTLKYASSINKELNNIQSLSYNKLLTVPWILIVFFIGLWGISTLIRKLGWKSEDDMHWWWGIILPNIFGLISLIFVVNWINN